MADTDDDLTVLIGRAALRDRAAFAALYSATAPKLFAILFRLLKDRTEAEDALQDVFVKIWNNAERYLSEIASPSSWLNAVARNHALDRIRARRKASLDLDTAESLADEGPGPETAAITRSEGRRIEACMEQLARERADAVRRAYVEGESYLELAARFGVPQNTMRSWLRRSLIQLRDCLAS